jgi:hypothetical protein
MVGALAHDHLADHAVGDGLARLPPLVAGSGLRSNLENALGLFHRVDQLLDLLVGMAHGLFEVDIFAVVHRIQSDLGVPVVGRGDNDRIDIRAAHHFAIIEVPFAFELRGVFALALLVDIAHRDDLAGVVLIADLLEHRGDMAAASTNADHADIDAIVRSEHAVAAHLGPARGENGLGHSDRKSCRARPPQKISSADGAVFFGHGFLPGLDAKFSLPEARLG